MVEEWKEDIEEEDEEYQEYDSKNEHVKKAVFSSNYTKLTTVKFSTAT